MELNTLSVNWTAKSPQFWNLSTNPSTSHIVVVIASITYDTTNCLVAYGVAPNLNSFLFVRLLPVEALGDFLKALVDGDPVNMPTPGYLAPWLQAVGFSNKPVQANSVDVTTPAPPPTGPKAQVVFAYASALFNVESLAELGAETIVVNQAAVQQKSVAS